MEVTPRSIAHKAGQTPSCESGQPPMEITADTAQLTIQYTYSVTFHVSRGAGG